VRGEGEEGRVATLVWQCDAPDGRQGTDLFVVPPDGGAQIARRPTVQEIHVMSNMSYCRFQDTLLDLRDCGGTTRRRSPRRWSSGLSRHFSFAIN